MKKTIAIAALILGLGTTSVFAATAAPKADASVSFTSLKNDKGFSVKVAAEKSVVIISDNDGNVIFKDRISKGVPAEKGYVISDLENGDYTVEVKTETGLTTKHMHVYEDGATKSYFFFQD